MRTTTYSGGNETNLPTTHYPDCKCSDCKAERKRIREAKPKRITVAVLQQRIEKALEALETTTEMHWTRICNAKDALRGK